MAEVLIIIFLVAVALILHTYVVYPLVVTSLPPKRMDLSSYEGTENWPVLAVLVAAYNEEKVIREKITSVYNTSYPQDKLHVYVGSDASADRTEAIVQDLSQTLPNLTLVKFGGRVGKISIINHLQSLGEQEILIMTDANVIFKPDTLPQLVKHFRDERVGIVAANIIKVSGTDEGISFQEKKYLSLENKIKAAESRSLGFIMGAEGGCYAIRNSLFSKVPLKFIVDDFYITMQVILRGKLALFCSEALCYEDVAADSAGEYRRKVRISSGNFQNLFFFRSVLAKFWQPLAFAFWSHKVLRWFTPFLLILALICTIFLLPVHPVFPVLFFLQVLFMLMPVFQLVTGFRNRLLLFISHFYLMNLALLEGFFRYTKGINSSIWQPVKRNV